MKRVTINQNHIGLVVKQNEVKRVLTTGKYWLGFGEQLEVHNMSKPLSISRDWDVLLEVEGIKDWVTIVEVGDNELVLVYLNDNFYTVLAAGRYLFWKALLKYDFVRADISKIDIGSEVDRHLLEKHALSNYVRSFKVEASEKALLFVDGIFKEILEAGTYSWWKNSTTIAISKIDMRQTSLEILGQEILTKDKAQLRINFSAQYQIIDIQKALNENKAFEKQLHVLLQLALRNFIGALTLDELMENKEQIVDFVLTTTAIACNELGVKLNHCGVKDIILPADVKDIMNQVLIAEKRAQANVVTRREETASTRSLLNTAKMMEENAMLFKLKEMEYIEKIAEKINKISISGGGQIADQLKALFVKN